MTEILALYLCAAVLGALLGWSVGTGRRANAAWPLFPAVLAILGLWKVTIYVPEVTTDLANLDGLAALLLGIGLAIVTLGTTHLGWKSTTGERR